jgi:hypothetical protein
VERSRNGRVRQVELFTRHDAARALAEDEHRRAAESQAQSMNK